MPEPAQIDSDSSTELPFVSDSDNSGTDPLAIGKGTLLPALLMLARSWLPSLALHLGIIVLISVPLVIPGMLDGQGQEHPVSIVMAEENEDGEVVYRDRDESDLASPTAPSNASNDGKENNQELLAALDSGHSDTSLDSIGLGALAGGGSEGGFNSMLGGSSGGGASFFGLESDGRNFVFVVDRSGSMNGPFLKAAKQELLRSLGSLPRGTRFHVMFYSSGRPSFIEAPGGKLVPRTRSHLQRTYAWIDSIRSGGGTDPLEAMIKAIKLRPDAIFFLTDGQFHPGIVTKITTANAGARRVKIMSIAFNKIGEALLKKLSANNQGKYRFVQPGVKP